MCKESQRVKSLEYLAQLLKDKDKKGLVGPLAKLNDEQVLKGLQHIVGSKKAKFKDRKQYFKDLSESDFSIESFPVAVIVLFPDDEEAVSQAKEVISKMQETERIVAEEKRKLLAFAKRYPKNVLGTYYRGDNRPPKDITGASGFTGFKVLTTQEAIEMARVWFGKGKGPVAYHQDWISNKTGGDKVATGNDIGCMGYGCTGPAGATRNVYQIVVPGLKIVQVTEEVLGCPIHSDVSGGKAPQLLLNADTLEKATVIGVGGVIAEETTFFTSLKPEWITIEYEKTGDDPKVEGRGWIKAL
ncbi:hypothetical protein [Aureispira sp. CCB-QB1]|uniref:hypothetical protein n=1 Tax=Aureispira sp. CCB-QB1 TaxID=1313421 RepID=UPI0006963916|nr:hypothetical protein [Aureispira sp. CCB-QB1]